MMIIHMTGKLQQNINCWLNVIHHQSKSTLNMWHIPGDTLDRVDCWDSALEHEGRHQGHRNYGILWV